MVVEKQRYIQLGDYSAGCRGFDAVTFAERFGEAFFLHHGPIGDLKAGTYTKVVQISAIGINKFYEVKLTVKP